jgi:hypothetical protein
VKVHLPYFSEKTRISVRNAAVEVKAFQVIVWVSISIEENSTWDPNIPRIPAILDIGTTHNFALTEEHLRTWAGLHKTSLREIGSVRIEKRKTELRSATLWLHTDNEPFELVVDDGIAVFDGDWPRLPVVGLRALTNSKLQTFIYGDTKQVVIRTPPQWYWPF